MVTILPIDVDEALVKEGVALAVAERLRAALKQLDEQAVELAVAGFVDREKWNVAFDALAELRRTMTPILEYACVFDDQEREAQDGDSDGTEA